VDGAKRPAAHSPGRPERLSGEDDIPEEVRDAICALGLAAAGANVIMQLSQLPIGHGVALSTVDEGRVDKHPIKRLRTTLSYIAVAMLGSATDRHAMRREVDRVHADVKSDASDPVPYSAFDKDLQLWVAACLYRGMEDVYRLLYPTPGEAALDAIYRHGKRFGTSLQVTDDQWPADRAAFEAYWNSSVARIEYDDVTRPYLLGIADLAFLRAAFGPAGAVVETALGPLNRFLTAGFLPPPFRDKLGLPWDRRRQRAFDAVTGGVASVIRKLPRPLRLFPFNLYLRDTRRRIRAGRPIV
jgi:uncharacterized protein (DUF2236 family)